MKSLVSCINLFFKKSKTPSALEIRGLLVLELTGSKHDKSIKQIKRKEFNPDKYQLFEDWLDIQDEFDSEDILSEKKEFEELLKKELKLKGHLFLPELGLFYLDKGEEKKGINPKNGLPMMMPARHSLFFFLQTNSEIASELNFVPPLPMDEGADYEKLMAEYFKY